MICNSLPVATDGDRNNESMKSSTKRAIDKYGIKTCIDAYDENLKGNGASTISFDFSVLKGSTRAADAAINAGRDLAYQNPSFFTDRIAAEA